MLLLALGAGAFLGGIAIAAAIHELSWRRRTRRRAFTVDLAGQRPRES